MSNDPRIIALGPGLPGPQGPTGPPGEDGSYPTLYFSWGDASPELVYSISASKSIYKIQLVILTGFNGTSPELIIGDSGDHSRLMKSFQNDPSTPGTYESTPGYKYNSPTDINLYITPGAGASSGNGLIILYLEK